MTKRWAILGLAATAMFGVGAPSSLPDGERLSLALASDRPPEGVTVTNPAGSFGERLSSDSADPGVERLAMAMPSSGAGDTGIELDGATLGERMDSLFPADDKPAATPAPAEDASAARAAIEGANSRWRAALRNGDQEALARIYTADASLVTPQSDSLEGRDRILAWLGDQRRAGAKEPELKTLDVVRVGDVAYEVGQYGLRFGDGDNQVAGDSGRYFAIWKAQADGTWLCQVGIWSSNRDGAVSR